MIDLSKYENTRNKDNILLLGTGPSIYCNLEMLKNYVCENNPIIVGINGCFHGLCCLKEQENLDTNIILPHILFSFFKFHEKYNKEGKKSDKNIHDIFTEYILKRKKQIVSNDTILVCPSKATRKSHRKFNNYAYVDWDYDKSISVDMHPTVEREISTRTMFKNGRILFKPWHGGEFVMAWAYHLGLSKIAICGILDFPEGNIKQVHRGWFWINNKHVMPGQMISNQSKIVDQIKEKYEENFTDLNCDSWKGTE